MEFIFPPKSSRDTTTVKKRIIIEAQKAIEKYKAAEDLIKETEKLSPVDSLEFDRPVFETTTLYYQDVKAEEISEGDDSDSIFSHHSLFYRNAFLNRCCLKLITNNRGFKLSWMQVLCFTFLLQVPLTAIVRHISMVQQFGALMVLLTYIVIGFSVCVPVYMLYMFMGVFTKRSYIRFWDCVPIFKGVAYSLAFISMYLEVHNVLFTSIAVQYLIWMFNDRLPWDDCDFLHASEECVPLKFSEKHSYTKECCHPQRDNCSYTEQLKTTFKYSAYEYYNAHVLYLDGVGKPISSSRNWNLIIILTVLWLIVCVMLILGLKRIARFMTIINLCMISALIPVALLMFVISPQFTVIEEFNCNFWDTVTSYQFWLYTGINIIHRELPADVIAYGSISRIGISLTVDAAIMFMIKLFFFALFTVWMCIGVQYQLAYYNIKFSNCIVTDGDVLFFALFPDIISHLPVPQIWLIIYYLLIAVWGLSTAIYVYMAFVDALQQEFRTLEKWRFFISVIICTAAAIYTAFDIRPDMMIHIKMNILEIIPQTKIFMLCVSFVGLYFYSITTFRHDYHFYNGTILGGYWTVGLKVSMLVVFISNGLNWFNQLNEEVGNYSLVHSSILVVLGVIITAMRYALKINNTLISPTPKWGPPSRNQKLARIKFDPSHDLHYRSVVQKCPHSCLLYSNALKKEVKHWVSKKNISEGRDLGQTLSLHTDRSKIKED
nr:sodium-dependent nutrient amino acid transporter 1-like [Onthophagus taurus]